MKITSKIYLIGAIIITLVSCDYGPKAILNNNFEPWQNNMPIDFKKLIGIYELDSISKKKNDIDLNEKLLLEIKGDSTFFTGKYIDNETGKIILEPKKGDVYIYNPKSKTDGYFMELQDLNLKTTQLYSRKNDSTVALYVLTKGYNGKESDYLRYIKVK